MLEFLHINTIQQSKSCSRLRGIRLLCILSSLQFPQFAHLRLQPLNFDSIGNDTNFSLLDIRLLTVLSLFSRACFPTSPSASDAFILPASNKLELAPSGTTLRKAQKMATNTHCLVASWWCTLTQLYTFFSLGTSKLFSQVKLLEIITLFADSITLHCRRVRHTKAMVFLYSAFVLVPKLEESIA